jgi:hypothetical protein
MNTVVRDSWLVVGDSRHAGSWAMFRTEKPGS